MQTITNAISDLWGNAYVKYALILGALFTVPMIFLSWAFQVLQASTGGN